MSVALSPSTPAIESPYISYSNSNTTSSRHFPQTSVQLSSESFELSTPSHNPTVYADSNPSPSTSPFREGHGSMEQPENLIRRDGGEESDEASMQQSHGQNHDRIDIEMEDEGTSIISSTVDLQSHLHATIPPNNILEEERMDTAPDNISQNGSHVSHPQISLPTTAAGHDQPQPNQSEDHEHPHGFDSTAASPPEPDTLLGFPDSRMNEQNGSDLATVSATSESEIHATETTAALLQGQPPSTDPLGLEVRPPPPSGPPAEDNNDDEEDGSSTDEEHGLWANLQEDVSTASEQEIREIEAGHTEVSALDHNHWETTFFQSLDDPDYVISDTGRITWIFKGFHGTQANPNKEKISRSPSVRIGGFDWNIKLFPRGNEGMDYVSVYIECTKSSEGTQERSSQSETVEAIPMDTGEGENVWGVAAQIGCVMYNPDEPRVQVNSKSVHHFSNKNQDWGWVRFHGPWDTIHKRQPMQRQALLRNDTLAFTAYIRTVEDFTGALWWHPSNDEPAWDSLAKTGYRGLTAHRPGGSALVAALSAWLHLDPISGLIINTLVPDSIYEPKARSRPLFRELKALLHAKRSSNVSQSSAISMEGVIQAIKWHDEDDISPLDVMAIWEVFRYVLNKEYSNTLDGPIITDALQDIQTFRQTMPSNTFVVSPGRSAPELCNTQEILDSATEDGNGTFRDWEGYYGTQKTRSPAPLILQIELHRQSYAADTRKWRKLTHRIQIKDRIVNNTSSDACMKTEYTLYGMIVHAGDLESEDYYTVIRPGGPKSKWVKYGGKRQGDVRFLTEKQAVQAHEGKDGSIDGTDAVAYIVMYVRSDCLSTILPSSIEPWKAHCGVRDPIQPLLSSVASTQASAPTLPVQIYTSKVFDQSSDRGIFDVWDRSLEDNSILYLNIPASSSLRDVQEELVTRYNLAGMPEQCRLWPMDMIRATSRWSPRFEELPYDTKLQDIADKMAGCYLWLHVVSIDSMPASLEQESTAEPTPEGIRLPRLDVMDSEFPASDVEIAALLATVPTPYIINPIPSPPATRDEDVTMGGTQDSEFDQNQEHQIDVAAPVLPAEPVNSDPNESTTELPTTTSVQPPVTPEALFRIVATISDEDPPATAPVIPIPVTLPKSEDVLFFVKSFDHQGQELNRLGVYLVSKQEKIGEVLQRLQTVNTTAPYELDIEEARYIIKSHIKARRSFEAERLSHGVTIVVQNRLSPSESRAIEAQGGCADLVEYYSRLASSQHPVWQRDHYVKSYFGSEYFDATLSRGAPHGHCVHVDMNGNAYSGNYTTGEKSGYGVMRYSNGDTYTGNWEAHLPEGQGSMVYGKTENRYEGGWKKGRRHGKGTMHFEVADEEMALCKICFEQEMDALFYRCGHVAACEECARQVKDCPICRREVHAVVKIWKTA